jgi:hypothetical protein
MRTLLLFLAGVLAGCATHVNVAPTHREDVSAQSRVLAIAARNLDDTARGRADVESARAAAAFHNETEQFARAAARWASDDDVNTRYERLIDAWVKLKQAGASLQADAVLKPSWVRVQYEWEKLARVSGYAGRHYEQKIEQRP